jgi:hypothetical protein
VHRIYTLGSRGREYLEREFGMPVTWQFRPEKVKLLSFNQILHALLLTRFVCAAHAFCRTDKTFTLSRVRLSYELSGTPGKGRTPSVIPDAWLLFEGEERGTYPVLFEMDRGMEYKEKFKAHVRGRLEYVRSGEYERTFGFAAVTIVYVTTGQKPEYRRSRLRAMREWTQEVLTEERQEDWAPLFRFAAVELECVYETPLFSQALWDEPFGEEPVTLLG